jgi:hypothetical protein
LDEVGEQATLSSATVRTSLCNGANEARIRPILFGGVSKIGQLGRNYLGYKCTSTFAPERRKIQCQRKKNPVSKKAADHHRKASEHLTHAARHHGEAAKHHEAGSHEKAAHHAHTATGHATHARGHADEASKAHTEEHGKK